MLPSIGLSNEIVLYCTAYFIMSSSDCHLYVGLTYRCVSYMFLCFPFSVHCLEHCQTLVTDYRFHWMHFVSAVQCSSLPIANSLYMVPHKTGALGKNDENGLYSHCVFSASATVTDTQIQTYPFISHTVSSVRGSWCYMHQWNASSHDQHSEISPPKPLASNDSGDRNPVGWMQDIKTPCQPLHRPLVPYSLINKLPCSHSQDHTL